jgi:hypothetical protein
MTTAVMAGHHVVGDETADHVIAGLMLPTTHQLLDVDVHGGEGLRPLVVGRVRLQANGGVVLEEAQVFGRHTK